MSFCKNMPKPFKRSVSIIGAGSTPFVSILDNPSVDETNEPGSERAHELLHTKYVVR